MNRENQMAGSRPIRFRAWDGFTMRYFDFSDIHGGNIGIPSWDDSLYLYGDSVKIMQFTGLFDKNNKEIKEIYEGDIIRIENKDYKMIREFGWKGKEDGFFEIYYDEETGAFMKKEKGWERGTYIWVPGVDCIEVIGNIYENPNLLNNKSCLEK